MLQTTPYYILLKLTNNLKTLYSTWITTLDPLPNTVSQSKKPIAANWTTLTHLRHSEEINCLYLPLSEKNLFLGRINIALVIRCFSFSLTNLLPAQNHKSLCGVCRNICPGGEKAFLNNDIPYLTLVTGYIQPSTRDVVPCSSRINPSSKK